MTPGLAIVGLACRYPDANNPGELWENILAQRRSFRRMPDERLRHLDYVDPSSQSPDLTYSTQAALIEGYEFDRQRFKVAGPTFRSADMAHWLALEVAADALADAGFADAKGLPRETTGVLVGNSLTGEFSRAATMRLRWPYVHRVVDARLRQEGWPVEKRQAFLADLEVQYKEPFAPVGDETLAGGLSNTIAGRICNYFDLGGGGFTIDGACSSSLLSLASACSALAVGDIDVALVGGVDLSLDPFELVGFARLNALATGDMRVYDANPTGFIPGEGCGFAVLMRTDEAVAANRKIYAIVRGWGISSDGSGGLTRPKAEGQRLSMDRAYKRAGYGIDTVNYFEGHGTGTQIGDAVELGTVTSACNECNAYRRPAVIGSIKANIGHTKAAAGLAGLIKATMAVFNRVIPPNTGVDKPHALLTDDRPMLRVTSQAEPWPSNEPVRAGISSMGFGGINVHVTIESNRQGTPRISVPVETTIPPDAELFLLSSEDHQDMRRQVDQLLQIAPRLSLGEISDLAATLSSSAGDYPIRAALVATRPSELADELSELKQWLDERIDSRLDGESGIFLGNAQQEPRIAFLFSGQAAPAHLDGGWLRKRFESVDNLYRKAKLPTDHDGIDTAVAQPAIVTASLAGLQALFEFNLSASLALGHSLGELTALHWAGVFSDDDLLGIARVRGRAMSERSAAEGSMAGITASKEDVAALLEGSDVVIACFNSPTQMVVSGEVKAVEEVVARAQSKGFNARRLPVSHAFHSPLLAEAVLPLAEHLNGLEFHPLEGTVISTVTGAELSSPDDLRELLCQQITRPVQFSRAACAAADGCDLFIEVGPGQILTGLVRRCTDIPAVGLDAGGGSARGLLSALAAAFALGQQINRDKLFDGRVTRPFPLDWQPKFFVNPCELAPLPDEDLPCSPARPCRKPVVVEATPKDTGADIGDVKDTLTLVKKLVARKAELALESISADSRLLDDLHLNSITVAQIVTQAARLLDLPPIASPSDYADATVGRVAEALENMKRAGTGFGRGGVTMAMPELDRWIRQFRVELIEESLSSHSAVKEAGIWKVLAPEDYKFAVQIEEALEDAAAGGYCVCLPPNPDAHHVGFLLDAARSILAAEEPTQALFVQHGGGAASFARTLHLEGHDLAVRVVDLPYDPSAFGHVAAECSTATNYTEAYYDREGMRRVPRLVLINPDETPASEDALGSGDVLLVTGGGKGIAAEAAAEIAREAGVGLVLVGRSDPQKDEELAANLERFKANNIDFQYFSADVTDRDAISKVIYRAQESAGPITAFLHGAGTNVPKLIRTLDEDSFRRTVATKVGGAHNVLRALDRKKLRLFVTFGSIIARSGMKGEADYALANEWLTRLTEETQAGNPHCRCVAVEWSVWSGVGMGERLGRIDSLIQQGVTPISSDEGIAILKRLISRRQPSVATVVTGRFGHPPALQLRKTELPLYRFLEQPRLHYPEIELVVDCRLSAATDPYMADHVFRGQRLLPGVMGLEAASQVSMALAESSSPPVFEDVRFLRPITVPEDTTRTIRLLAVQKSPGLIEVALRSDETAFATDHFRATCDFTEMEPQPDQRKAMIDDGTPHVPLDPEADLYGSLLFHSGRFRRLTAYRRLSATDCLAEIRPVAPAAWFGDFLPPILTLGDPAVRDVTIHAIQACVPNASLLPIGAKRLVCGRADPGSVLFVHAVERFRTVDVFTYDVEVTDGDGLVLEHWEGLQLQIVAGTEHRGDWVEPLLGPYLERRTRELFRRDDLSVVIDCNGRLEPSQRSDTALQRALGSPAFIRHRPDGKPEVGSGWRVSASDAGDITLAVAARASVGCDIEKVKSRSEEVWRDLLQPHNFELARVIAGEAGEDVAVSATRIWSAMESLKKAGKGGTHSLALHSNGGDGWVELASGHTIVATYATGVRTSRQKMIFAVMVANHE